MCQISHCFCFYFFKTVKWKWSQDSSAEKCLKPVLCHGSSLTVPSVLFSIWKNLIEIFCQILETSNMNCWKHEHCATINLDSKGCFHRHIGNPAYHVGNSCSNILIQPAYCFIFSIYLSVLEHSKNTYSFFSVLINFQQHRQVQIEVHHWKQVSSDLLKVQFSLIIKYFISGIFLKKLLFNAYYFLFFLQLKEQLMKYQQKLRNQEQR